MSLFPITRPREFFPGGLDELLTNYRWEIIQLIGTSLGPGEEQILYDKEQQGFLVFAFLKTDNPDVEVELDLHADGSIEVAISPSFLYEIGMIYPNPSAAYLTRYDETNNIYAAFYTPTPWLPFRTRARVTIRNPSANNASVDFNAWLLVRR